MSPAMPPGPSEQRGAVSYTGGPLSDTLCGSLALAHWKPGPDGAPVVCVLPHECDKMSGLDLAFMLKDELVITLEAPVAPDPRAEPGPHPRINIHLNPGTGYGHSGCAIVDACVVCSDALWNELFTHGHGTIGRHLSDMEQAALDECDENTPADLIASLFPGTLSGNTVTRPFRTIAYEAAVDAIDIARARYQP